MRPFDCCVAQRTRAALLRGRRGAREPRRRGLSRILGGIYAQLRRSRTPSQQQARPLVLLSALALALVAVPAAATSRNAAIPGIASLGDSYSSGEGNPPFDKGTDVFHFGRRLNGCHRTVSAWARLLGTKPTTHLACSGAKIGDLYSGQETRAPDNVGQLERLKRLSSASRVSVVVITIGGNDLGFAAILKECRFAALGCLRQMDKVELPRLAEIRPRLVKAYKAIVGAAPAARVLVVGYPAIFPTPKSRFVDCGWLTDEEKVRVTTLTRRLEDTIRGAAREAGVEFVSVLEALRGHELCTPDSWIVPITSLQTGPLDQRQAHPTVPGQKAIFQVVARYLRRTVPSPEPPRPPRPRNESLSAGHGHTCVVRTGAAVLCWGRNQNGQLGDGTTVHRSSPVPVGGLPNDVVAISGGGAHTCAMTRASRIYCWGKNDRGQLGDGSSTERLTPVEVERLPRSVSAVSAGHDHTCALTSEGAVFCWGNTRGGPSSVPVAVRQVPGGVVAIQAGLGRTCAVTRTGRAYCWGNGLLGDGTFNGSATPVEVDGLSGVVALAHGKNSTFTCGLTSAGAVWCWGANTIGSSINEPKSAYRLSPVTLRGLSNEVVAISGGGSHACVLMTAGAVQCLGWGELGQLGGGYQSSDVPVPVGGLPGGVVALAAGGGHTCALIRTGAIYCWGADAQGQLGDGASGGRSPSPRPVMGLGP